MEKTIHSPEHRVLIELLVRLRKSRGYNQTQFARRLGVHQSFVSKYEKFQRRIDLVEVRRIAVELDFDLLHVAREYEAALARQGLARVAERP